MSDLSSSTFERKESVERQISSLRHNISAIEALQRRSARSASTSEETQNTQEFRNQCANANKKADTIRSMLQDMKRNASDPVAKNLRVNMIQKFMTVLTTYQQAQSAFTASQKQKMARQYRIVNPNASEQEIQQAVSENNAGSVFTQDMVGGAKYNRAQAVLSQVEDRHAELLKMATLVQEVQQMFLELQDMLQMQDGYVDQIAANTDSTEHNTRNGAKEMTEAVVSRKQARKKKCILIICVIVLLLIVGVVIFFYTAWPIIQAKALDNKAAK